MVGLMRVEVGVTQLLSYAQCSVVVLCKVIPKSGLLVVKNPADLVSPPEVPGILGMNVCYVAMTSFLVSMAMHFLIYHQ